MSHATRKSTLNPGRSGTLAHRPDTWSGIGRKSLRQAKSFAKQSPPPRKGLHQDTENSAGPIRVSLTCGRALSATSAVISAHRHHRLAAHPGNSPTSRGFACGYSRHTQPHLSDVVGQNQPQCCRLNGQAFARLISVSPLDVGACAISELARFRLKPTAASPATIVPRPRPPRPISEVVGQCRPLCRRFSGYAFAPMGDRALALNPCGRAPSPLRPT